MRFISFLFLFSANKRGRRGIFLSSFFFGNSPAVPHFQIKHIYLVALRTGQYLWEYGTGKFATGPRVILGPQLDGATGYFEG